MDVNSTITFPSKSYKIADHKKIAFTQIFRFLKSCQAQLTHKVVHCPVASYKYYLWKFVLVESITVWLQSHRLQDLLGEERVFTDEADNTEEKIDTIEAKGDPATVSGRFLVATSYKYYNEMKTWRDHKKTQKRTFKYQFYLILFTFLLSSD